MKKHVITREEYEEIKAYAKKNKDKDIDRKLQVIIQRYEGKKDREIAEKLGYHRQWVSRLCAEYAKNGLEKYGTKQYHGNHRNLTFEQEAEILEKFSETGDKGEIITVKEIKAAFDEAIGKETHISYIYKVLARHSWRKVMPRSRHPKKASDEAINASKKLKQK